MSRACSVSARRVYGKARVCRLWGVARSTHYARQAAAERPVQAQRRGLKPVLPDDELVVRIREVLSEAWLALGAAHEAGGQNLLPPHRAGHDRGPRVHDGTIIPDGPNRMWGTDATQVQTRLEGTATVFVAIDHFVGDVVGIHAARPGTRFEALEPIYQGLREHYGPLAQDIAEGLVLRHDHGPQYMSHAFQQEIAFLGIESSPSFIKAPEGNGVAERFIRTLKEQLLWLQTFDTVEELRQALLEFRGRFNKHWLRQRHGYATPNQVCASHAPVAEAA